MVTFKLKNGVSLEITMLGRCNWDPELVSLVLQHFFDNNEVTMVPNAIYHCDPADFSSTDYTIKEFEFVDLTINERKLASFCPYLYNLLDAIGLTNEQEFVAYFNNMQTVKEGLYPALNADAFIKTNKERVIKFSKWSFDPIKENQINSLWKVETIISSLTGVIVSTTFFNQEQLKITGQLLGGLVNAFQDIHDKTNGTYETRIIEFTGKITPMLTDAAKQLELTWGDYILNILKEILNALMFAFTLGQAPSTFFFQVKSDRPVIIVNRVKTEIEEALTTISGMTA